MYDDNMPYKDKVKQREYNKLRMRRVRAAIPDRTKCFICKHVFTEDEIRWASPVMESLCNACHTDYLSAPLIKEI